MGLRAYIIRRVLLMIPTLLGAILLIFALTQLFDPVTRASLYITNVQQFTPENIQKVIDHYGLNEPAYIQFFGWFKQILRGNLGYSRIARASVLDTMMSKFPATAELVIYTAPTIILLGIYLGIKSATNRDKPVDHVIRLFTLIGWALPSFWFGIVLLAIFYVGLGVFPPGRLGIEAHTYIMTSPDYIKYTGIITIDSLLNGQIWIFLDAIERIILPIVVLTTISIAMIIRLMRSSMLEALNKGYIVTARAKGLTKNEVINKHARRNALIPTLTLSGMMVAGMLNGLVITETVFGINGLGQWAAASAINVDIPAVLGFTLFSGFLFVTANLIVDILYAYVDPRIRLG